MRGRGWVVRRRLQRGESADWLLLDPARQLIALEISGSDQGDPQRLTEKLVQVAKATAAEQRAACVVRLVTPAALLARVEA